MDSKKESEANILKLTKEIEKLRAKLLAAESSNKELRGLIKYLKRRIKYLEESRDRLLLVEPLALIVIAMLI